MKMKKSEKSKKVLVKFSGDKCSGKSTLMMALMATLKGHGIKYSVGVDDHTLCVETKRKDITDMIREIKV